MSGIAGYFQTEFDVERNHTLYAIYESKLTNMQDSLITNCHENSIIYMKHHIGQQAIFQSHIEIRYQLPIRIEQLLSSLQEIFIIQMN